MCRIDKFSPPKSGLVRAQSFVAISGVQNDEIGENQQRRIGVEGTAPVKLPGPCRLRASLSSSTRQAGNTQASAKRMARTMAWMMPQITRRARNAVVGPCVAWKEPCASGKKNRASTQAATQKPIHRPGGGMNMEASMIQSCRLFKPGRSRHGIGGEMRAVKTGKRTRRCAFLLTKLIPRITG
jgi:hypothetical protein